MYVETLDELRSGTRENWHEHKIIIGHEFRSHPRTKQMFDDIRTYHRDEVGSDGFAYTCVCSDDNGDVEVVLRYRVGHHRISVKDIIAHAISDIFNIRVEEVSLFHAESVGDIDGSGCRCPLL